MQLMSSAPVPHHLQKDHFADRLIHPYLKLDEDVIVINPKHPKYHEIGQVWKIRETKISICYDGEVYSSDHDDFVIA